MVMCRRCERCSRCERIACWNTTLRACVCAPRSNARATVQCFNSIERCERAHRLCIQVPARIVAACRTRQRRLQFGSFVRFVLSCCDLVPSLFLNPIFLFVAVRRVLVGFTCVLFVNKNVCSVKLMLLLDCLNDSLSKNRIDSITWYDRRVC
jgi:hypothetical protein